MSDSNVGSGIDLAGDANSMPGGEGGTPVSPEMGPIGAADGALHPSAQTTADSTRDQQEAQLNQEIAFNRDVLKALKGLRDVVETAWISAKLGDKVGPGIRLLNMLEEQTKYGLKRAEGLLADMRRVTPAAKEGAK